MSYYGLDRPHSPRYYRLRKCLFFVSLSGVVLLIFMAAGSVEYTWRWRRVPQYFWATGISEVRGETEGTVLAVEESARGSLLRVAPRGGGAPVEQMSWPRPLSVNPASCWRGCGSQWK